MANNMRNAVGSSICDTVLRDSLQRLLSSTTHPKHPHQLDLKDNKESYKCHMAATCEDLGKDTVVSSAPATISIQYAISVAQLASLYSMTWSQIPPSNFFMNVLGAAKNPVMTIAVDSERLVHNLQKVMSTTKKVKKRIEGSTFIPVVSLFQELNFEGNEYELSTNGSPKCQLKGKRHVPPGSVTGNRGWFCVSTCEKKYNFHVYCAINMSLEEGNDGNLSLAKKDTDKFIENYGENFVITAIKVARIVVRFLPGDPCVFIDVMGLLSKPMT